MVDHRDMALEDLAAELAGAQERATLGEIYREALKIAIERCHAQERELERLRRRVAQLCDEQRQPCERPAA